MLTECVELYLNHVGKCGSPHSLSRTSTARVQGGARELFCRPSCADRTEVFFIKNLVAKEAYRTICTHNQYHTKGQKRGGGGQLEGYVN